MAKRKQNVQESDDDFDDGNSRYTPTANASKRHKGSDSDDDVPVKKLAATKISHTAKHARVRQPLTVRENAPNQPGNGASPAPLNRNVLTKPFKVDGEILFTGKKRWVGTKQGVLKSFIFTRFQRLLRVAQSVVAVLEWELLLERGPV